MAVGDSSGPRTATDGVDGEAAGGGGLEDESDGTDRRGGDVLIGVAMVGLGGWCRKDDGFGRIYLVF